MIILGAWKSRNKDIFHDLKNSPLIYAIKIIVILSHFQQQHMTISNKPPSQLMIDETQAWSFFYGVASSMPKWGSIGGNLYISESRYYKFVTSIGWATNNRVELSSILLVINLAQHLHIPMIHIYGDSKHVVDWLNQHISSHNITL